MSLESTCRVCLVRGTTQAIEDSQLKETFEEITKCVFVSNHALPKNLCNICLSLLQRCHRFKTTAQRSERIFRDMLSNSTEVFNTKTQDLGLTWGLSKSLSFISTDDPPTDDCNGYYACMFDGLWAKQEVTVKVESNDSIEENSENSFEKSLKEKIPAKGKKNVTIFKCTFCPKTFNYEGHLNRHLRSHINMYICDRCSKKFKLKSAFEAHMRTHTGEKPFSCEVCGKTFNQKSHLKTHIRTHTGLKPFACERCDKTFRQRAQLISHLRTHTGERPFACNHCHKSFGHLTTLRKHRKLHLQVKTFPCNLCPVSFDQESSLTNHLRVHTANRPYTCQKCNKSFLEARHLKEHLLVHSVERRFECKCGKRYKRAEHLKHHLRLAKCVQRT